MLEINVNLMLNVSILLYSCSETVSIVISAIRINRIEILDAVWIAFILTSFFFPAPDVP